jgi:hypothetical protein
MSETALVKACNNRLFRLHAIIGTGDATDAYEHTSGKHEDSMWVGKTWGPIILDLMRPVTFLT